MSHVTFILTVVVGFLSVWGLAVPAPHTSRNPASLDFTSDFFRGALPTEELGIVGPVIAPDAQLINTTNALTTRDESQWELRITMGTSFSHVGLTVLHKSSMFIRQFLERACGIQQPHVPPLGKVPGSVCSHMDQVTISNIFDNGDHDSVLKVKIESDYIPETRNTDELFLLKHFIDQIVLAFEASTSCDKNRYVERGKGGCSEYANSADFYQVGIHGMHNIFPHLRVQITYHTNPKSNKGQFDCKGSLTNVWGTLPESRVKDYADMMGFPVRGAIGCADMNGPVEGLPTGNCQWDRSKPWSCGVAVKPEVCKV